MIQSWENSVTDGRTDGAEFIGPSDKSGGPTKDMGESQTANETTYMCLYNFFRKFLLMGQPIINDPFIISVISEDL